MDVNPLPGSDGTGPLGEFNALTKLNGVLTSDALAINSTKRATTGAEPTLFAEVVSFPAAVK